MSGLVGRMFGAVYVETREPDGGKVGYDVRVSRGPWRVKWLQTSEVKDAKSDGDGKAKRVE